MENIPYHSLIQYSILMTMRLTFFVSCNSFFIGLHDTNYGPGFCSTLLIKENQVLLENELQRQ